MASNQEFGIEMFVEYSLDAIQNIFNPRNDLGKSGEVFLASNKGLFITKQMYHCGDGDLCGTKNVISTNPMTACLQNNNNQMLDLDYRGVKIIHGFRYVPEIGGGCIMAHINQVEAFAPLNALQKKILTIAVALLFVFVILIYIFTSTITNPLLRLKDIVETSGNDNINSLIKRKDEIGHLANAFNKLILSQTESRETLEQHQQTIFESSKLNAMGEMARGVAHEINSPLAAVMLGAELIEYKNAKTPEPNKDITKLAKSIMEAGARISIIVKGLKGISRDATADTEETFTIRHLLDSTLSLCGQMLIANNIELIIEEGQLDVRLHGKETLLSQCLLNLITNAFEAVQVLDKKWIKLDVLIVDETIELRISDSGTGISSEIRKLMFRPMYTTKPIGSGPGLGLSMSRSIITNFGGNIIYDEENDHTCFIMKWPYS
jgi:C4-dicarboxylate-specific signal transduction histidine kinase